MYLHVEYFYDTAKTLSKLSLQLSSINQVLNFFYVENMNEHKEQSMYWD